MVRGSASLDLVEGRHDLVVEIIDHVAADRGDAVGGVNVDVHRALGVGVGGLAVDAGHQLDRAGDFQIEEAQRALGVQAVDQVLDVGQRDIAGASVRTRNIRARGG